MIYQHGEIVVDGNQQVLVRIVKRMGRKCWESGKESEDVWGTVRELKALTSTSGAKDVAVAILWLNQVTYQISPCTESSHLNLSCHIVILVIFTSIQVKVVIECRPPSFQPHFGRSILR